MHATNVMKVMKDSFSQLGEIILWSLVKLFLSGCW